MNATNKIELIELHDTGFSGINHYSVGGQIDEDGKEYFIEEMYYTVLDSEIEIDLFLEGDDGKYIKKIKYSGSYTASRKIQKVWVK